jgi:hypothetical protein
MSPRSPSDQRRAWLRGGVFFALFVQFWIFPFFEGGTCVFVWLYGVFRGSHGGTLLEGNYGRDATTGKASTASS